MKAILIEGSEGHELEDNINTKVKSFKAKIPSPIFNDSSINNSICYFIF